MKGKLALITILTNDVIKLSLFYKDVLGFALENESENYVELNTNSSIRFAICSRSVLANSTGDVSYKEEKRGQSFELAFPVKTRDELEMTYQEITDKGAMPVKPPTETPWGQITAFFADPDGNIHELFCE
jgi:lactoylglutathione lyase